MTFADRLRELREQAGMTQAKLAEDAGLSTGAIRNYEQGIREPYWQIVFKLADALGVDCSAFKDCIDADTPQSPASKRAGANKPAGKRTTRKRNEK